MIWKTSATKLLSSNFRRLSTLCDKWAVIDGIRINYCDTGNGKEPLLLLPGLLGSWRTDFTEQLTDKGGLNGTKFRLIGWDPPGYGKSRPPDKNYTMNYLHDDAKMAHKFMTELGFGSSYSVCGWSDGGCTGLIMAALYPSSVKKMVAIGANAYVAKEDADFWDSIADVTKWSGRMVENYKQIYNDMDYVQKCWDGCRMACRNWVDRCDGSIFVDLLPKIFCPVLLIHGDKDRMTGPHHSKFIQQRIPTSRLIMVSDGKHDVHLQKPKEVNAIIDHFLTEDDI